MPCRLALWFLKPLMDVKDENMTESAGNPFSIAVNKSSAGRGVISPLIYASPVNGV